MLFQDPWPLIQDLFEWIAHSQSIMVILSGMMCLVWIGYEVNRRGSILKRKTDDFEFDITKFLRGLSYLGIILGIICIWAGATGLILKIPPSDKYAENLITQGVCTDIATCSAVDHFTCIWLIFMGVIMFLKPINDLPWAGIIGLFAGAAVAIIVSMIIPDWAVEWIAGYINPKWALIIIFLVVAAIVGLTVKFWIDALMMISKVLSWPPIAVILMVVCFIQGFALWIWGVSLIPNLLT
jgi:hypothetical protein